MIRAGNAASNPLEFGMLIVESKLPGEAKIIHLPYVDNRMTGVYSEVHA
jgi:hypothetical protein